jgi:hypothetical protein
MASKFEKGKYSKTSFMGKTFPISETFLTQRKNK